jgi:uncharacterized membrane protein
MAKPPHSLRGHGQQPNQVQTQQVSVSRQWTGPLPPPEALEKYNRSIPNGAERIVAMAEKEQGHRIEYEKLGLSASIIEARIGQIIGAIICVGAVAGSIYAASIGAQFFAIAILSIPLLGIIKAFMRPREK